MNTSLYYVKAKVTIRVDGISGPFEQNVSALVHGLNTIGEVKKKFETYARTKFSHMTPSNITFEYLEIAEGI